MDPLSLDEIFTQILEFLMMKRQNQTWGVKKEVTMEAIVVHKIPSNNSPHTLDVALLKTETFETCNQVTNSDDNVTEVQGGDKSPNLFCLKDERLSGFISNGDGTDHTELHGQHGQHETAKYVTRGAENHSCFVKLERIELDQIEEDDSGDGPIDDNSDGLLVAEVAVLKLNSKIGNGILQNGQADKLRQKGKKRKKEDVINKTRQSMSKSSQSEIIPEFQPVEEKGKLNVKEEEREPGFNPLDTNKPLKNSKSINPIKPAKPAGRHMRVPIMKKPAKPGGRPLRFPDMTKDENGILNCPHCSAKFKSASSANVHYTKYHHDPVDISCEVCPKRFNYKMQYDIHQDYAHNDGTGKHVCPHCGIRYKILQNLRRHDRIAHFKGDKEKVIPCRFCDVMFCKNSPEKQEHVINEHKDKLLYCSICSKHVETEPMMHHHIRNKHGGVSPQLIPCAYCREKFLTRDSLLYHYDERHEDQEMHVEKPFVCQIGHCQRRFRCLSFLERHGDHHEHISKKRARAKIKPKAVTDKDVHDDNVEKSPCPTCGKLIATCKMKAHMRFHDNTTFACDECDKIFHHWERLKEHKLQKHIKIELICPIESCGKIFHRRRVLKSHIDGVHGNKPALPCDRCDKTFAYKSDLVIHIRGVHEGKMSCCFVCGKQFVRPSEKNRHEKQVHNLNNSNS